jgi:hypothetical protein
MPNQLLANPAVVDAEPVTILDWEPPATCLLSGEPAHAAADECYGPDGDVILAEAARQFDERLVRDFLLLAGDL